MTSLVPKPHIPTGLSELIDCARLAGASDAAVIDTGDIIVEEDLARLCRQPRCQNYGLSPSCPPHVAGPAGFRKWLQEYRQALVIKIDVPSEILLSSERWEVMQLLHEIAAHIELTAIKMGYTLSRAFAGGSCKMIFCRDHSDCRVVDQGGKCRNPLKARPSMSGFGINVSRLMQTAGWNLKRVKHDPGAVDDSTGTVSALVLIG